MTRRHALALDGSTYTVAVWHNTTCSFEAWRPDDPMIKVFAYQIPAKAALIPERVLTEACRTFNISDDELAQAYRACRLRSLSGGDVVAIGESAWACDSVGWRPLRLATAES